MHRSDAARLFRLALENGVAGARYHGVADEGIAFRRIAELIGRGLHVPVVGIEAKAAAKRFGFRATFVLADNPASSALTRAQLGWEPREPGLIADLEPGRYFETAAAGAAAPAAAGGRRVSQAARGEADGCDGLAGAPSARGCPPSGSGAFAPGVVPGGGAPGLAFQRAGGAW